MGRVPTVNLNLPERMRARRRGDQTYYYYDTGGKPRKEVPLGSDYLKAVQRWTEMHRVKAGAKLTVAWAIQQYKDSPAYTALEPGSQDDYGYALDKILEHFGDAPLDEVRTSHINLYIDLRKVTSKHRALRERNIFSMLFNWCIAREYCAANPAAAVKMAKLPGRAGIYIEDQVFEDVYQAGSQDLQDAMDLGYILGQRPVDVLGLSDANVIKGDLVLRQTKTDKPMRIAIRGHLKKLLARMRARRAATESLSDKLLVDMRGKPMTESKLRIRFVAAREVVGALNFQFRDLRRKAAADLRDIAGIDKAQQLLAHSNSSQTEHYASGKPRVVTDLPEMTKTRTKKIVRERPKSVPQKNRAQRRKGSENG